MSQINLHPTSFTTTTAYKTLRLVLVKVVSFECDSLSLFLLLD